MENSIVKELYGEFISVGATEMIATTGRSLARFDLDEYPSFEALKAIDICLNESGVILLVEKWAIANNQIRQYISSITLSNCKVLRRNKASDTDRILKIFANDLSFTNPVFKNYN